MAQPIWNTTSGSLGEFYALSPTGNITLEATPISPANSVYYTLIGTLPPYLTLDGTTGNISGTPAAVTKNTIKSFVVRATDNISDKNYTDRNFEITILLPQPIWQTQQDLGSFPNSVNTFANFTSVGTSNLIYCEDVKLLGLTRNVIFTSTPKTLYTVNATSTGNIVYFYGNVSANNLSTDSGVIFSANFAGLTANQKYFIKEILSTTSNSAVTLKDFNGGNVAITSNFIGNISSTYNENVGGLVTGNAYTINTFNTTANTFNVIDETGNVYPLYTEAGEIDVQLPFYSTLNISLVAIPTSPANTITYTLLNGELPSGLSLNSYGTLTGNINLVTENTTKLFTVRATDELGYFKDRTFEISITSTNPPNFTTPAGNILYTFDSVWIEQQISYSNPDPTNLVDVELISGSLPPGLEISPEGIIRGYANPPVLSSSFSTITTTVLSSNATSNIFNSISTSGFSTGRPVQFEGTVFGGVSANTTYYLKTINNITDFSIANTINGDQFQLTSSNGTMTANLFATTAGEPVTQTYPFTLRLNSLLGDAQRDFSITVENWNIVNPPNTRIPTILNTRPLSYDVANTEYAGYYILPPVSPSSNAFIGNIQSDNYFTFKVIGYDFDGDDLTYQYANLPTGLTGNIVTGWITGNISIPNNTIETYAFSANVYKTTDPLIFSDTFNFSLTVENNVSSSITWVTNDNLGNILNGGISYFNIEAIADVEIEYQITAGNLPPNLRLEPNGQIIGRIAFQPTSEFLNTNTETTFTFTVEAYSPDFSAVSSSKQFTITVIQEYETPTDILYIKATPSLADRALINSLLTSDTLIPPEKIYRPDDIYFGKASSVIYEHAFGIYASNIEKYLIAASKNHYWRNITLGQLKTAVAKNDAGEVIYEVVYSEVIDNLVNPAGVSVAQEIMWPRLIPLDLGPWYTSTSDIFTSFIFGDDTLLGEKEYYTSLTPGYAQDLYPNSLYNMRTRVGNVVGQEYDSRLLPKWMTSQQANGSTLGYTQAWVICYLKPTTNPSTNPEGRTNAEQVKYNIENNWKDYLGNNYKLNLINFQLDRFTVNKSATYDYDNSVNPAAWTQLPGAAPQPNPLDSKDFYVLFPRKTILPNETQT